MIATTPEIDAVAFRPFEATTPAAPAKSEDQAGFLRRLASRLGADPRDERAGTPEGLARLGAERLVSTALLEPLILVFLGVGVGGLLIAMYLPIFNIAGSIQT